ncbi:MAG: histidine kinase [Desulfobacter sp.]|nr:histidine kinase [Desulfobacter sp.]
MLVALVPLVSFGYIGISQGKQMIEEKAALYLMNLSKRNAESIRQFMIERVNDMNLLCSILDISDSNFEHHINQLKNDPHRPYIDFFILSQSKRLIFSSKGKSIDPKILKKATEPGLSWKGVQAGTLFLLADKDQLNPVLILSKKLTNQNEDDPKYLYTMVDFRFIDVLLKENNIEDTGEVYLVNKGGWFLSASRFGAKALQTKISIQTPVLNTLLPARQSIDYRGKTVLQSQQSIPPFNWIVFADQDMVEILNRIKALEKKALIYAAITGCVVFLLAFFISAVIANMVKEKYQREKEMEFQVIQKEKLASLGLLTSGLAHELNTPLANALLYTQIALEELADKDLNRNSIGQHLSTVIDEVKQGSNVIKNLMYFSRHTHSDSKTVDCNRLLTKLMEITIPHCNSKKIDVKLELEKNIPDVVAHASTVQSILTNLVANAVEAMPDGGSLILKTHFVRVLKMVKIEVNDSGSGISKQAISNIFTPFYSTKKPGEGTGLGLFISYEMAKKLGGDLRVVSATSNNSKQSGTSFTLELPIED